MIEIVIATAVTGWILVLVLAALLKGAYDTHGVLRTQVRAAQEKVQASEVRVSIVAMRTDAVIRGVRNELLNLEKSIATSNLSNARAALERLYAHPSIVAAGAVPPRSPSK